ncbi:hypothetical protein [Flavobacterium subsaxonicum]|uniref:Uncharacterized protein n=1 Tax=Flavobacterium subsaxonicum WB 4.1-42 = DSM 21790 TaxID=1121898 RepID=A0A0A2MII9_9FLAO|nr:hypothetical protein [Flavobacterium subsaxonicum]KGO91268.1 hypothetical protein Q766_19115 [Flavobacterium subsaxonicum WB 4.1-42 = DSM 21790]
MRKKKLIKYGTLFLIGTLLLYNILPMGDYGRGMGSGLALVLFGSILILAFIIVALRFGIALYRGQKDYDFIPLLIIACYLLIAWIALAADGHKFWTNKVLGANIENQHTSGGSLTLYKNNSFAATRLYADFSETFQGNYTIVNDTLYLERDNLSKITDSLFTTQYFISKKDSTLFAKGTGFDNLKIAP